MDDDVILRPDCIQRLQEALNRLGSEVAVGPSILNIATNRSIYYRVRRHPLIEALYYRILNGVDGFLPGTITLAGVNLGWDPSLSIENFREVEWLAGGCVMHRKSNLFLENYFPFEGKAYCEDLIHSHLLRSRGIKLFVIPRAVCLTESNLNSKGKRSELRELFEEYRARKYFLALISRSSWRLHLFYIVRILSWLLNTIRNFFRI